MYVHSINETVLVKNDLSYYANILLSLNIFTNNHNLTFGTNKTKNNYYSFDINLVDDYGA